MSRVRASEIRPTDAELSAICDEASRLTGTPVCLEARSWGVKFTGAPNAMDALARRGGTRLNATACSMEFSDARRLLPAKASTIPAPESGTLEIDRQLGRDVWSAINEAERGQR